MIPYLKLGKEASVSAPVSVEKRKPDQDSEYDPLEVAAEDLCNAIAAKDYKAIAEALRAAFQLADSEPHIEGEHIG